MSVDILQTLSAISFLIAFIFLVASVVMFFLLDIKRIYGEITGRTEKKAVEAIRQQIKITGTASKKVTQKLTSKMKLKSKKTGETGALNNTSKPKPVREKPAAKKAEPKAQAAVTAPDNNTGYQESGQTQMLSTALQNRKSLDNSSYGFFVEIGYLGSDEIIE